MRRSWAVAVGLIVVAALAWWWLRGGDASEGPGVASAAPSGLAPGAPGAAVSKWSQPVTPRGQRKLRGLVRRAGAPVPAATVTALEAHAPGTLSDLPCRCDNHCGKRLLECGCSEAAAQLVELVTARFGEVQPVGRAVTGADGRFELDGLPEDAVALWADDRTGVAWQPEVAAGADDVTLTLEPGVRIEGTVKGDDEAPVPGAVVTAIFAEHSRFFDAVVDAHGAFSMGPLLPGKYAVVAVREGLMADHRQVAEAGEAPIELVLSAPRRLAGSVTRAGQAVAGATVKLDGMHRKRTETSGADGTFRFEGLRPGNYELVATAPGASATVSTRVARTADRLGVELAMGAGVDFGGTVVDHAGQPVVEARVEFDGDRVRRAAFTDATGTFRFEGLKAGSWSLGVMKKGFLPSADMPVTLAPGVAPARVVLEPASVLAGRVVDEMGKVVSAFEVSAERPRPPDAGSPSAEDEYGPPSEPGASAEDTSVDGGFALEVRPGPYRLTVTPKDLQSTSMDVVAPARDLVVTVRSGGRISGRVVDADEQPLPSVSVIASHAEAALAEQRSAAVDREGHFELKGLSPGAVLLQVAPDRASRHANRAVQLPPEQTVVVRDGEVTTVTLRAPRGAAISGVVVNSEGQPVDKVYVLAASTASKDAPRLKVETGPDGTFWFEGLATGPTRVTAFDGRGERQVSVTISAPGSDVRLRLGGGTVITGRVVGENDQPVTSFTIHQRPFEAPDGRFSVPAAPGHIELVFDADGYAQLGLPVEVKAGSNEVGDVHLSRGRPVSGVVRDAVSGQPIADALVDVGTKPVGGEPPANIVLSEHLGAARSDETGHYRLARVDGHSDTLFATHQGHVPSAQPLAPGASTVDVAMAPGARLVISLLGVNGAPLPGWPVAVVSNAAKGTVVARSSKAKNELVAEGLSPGEWSVAVFATSQVFHPVTVNVSAGQTMPLTLREATDGVEVVVTGSEAGRLAMWSGPPPKGPLSPDDLYSSGREALTASQCRFTHVRPGLWTLFAYRMNAEGAPEQLMLPVTVGAEAQTFALPTTGWQPFVPPR